MPDNKYTILDLDEFKALIKKGHPYTGLVEMLGYVYWTDEIVYFVRINPEELFGVPKFKEVPIPYSFHNSQPVISKIRKVMHILSKDELRRYNFDMYFQFYGIIEKMNKHVCETDAISNYRKIGSNSISDRNIISEASDVVGSLDTVTGWLEDANVAKKPKWIKYLQRGVTVLSIYQDIRNEQYIDAAGKVLSEYNPYSTWIDIGKAILSSDCMQFRLARLYAKEYLEAVAEHKKWSIIQEQAKKAKKSGLYRDCAKKLDEYSDIAQENYVNFQKCMDKLGYKYY